MSKSAYASAQARKYGMGLCIPTLKNSESHELHRLCKCLVYNENL